MGWGRGGGGVEGGSCLFTVPSLHCLMVTPPPEYHLLFYDLPQQRLCFLETLRALISLDSWLCLLTLVIIQFAGVSDSMHPKCEYKSIRLYGYCLWIAMGGVNIFMVCTDNECCGIWRSTHVMRNDVMWFWRRLANVYWGLIICPPFCTLVV